MTGLVLFILIICGLTQADAKSSTVKKKTTRTHLQENNLIFFSYGSIDGPPGGSAGAPLNRRVPQANISWAYQFDNNYFAELLYGKNTERGFPAQGLDSEMINVTLRLKYNFFTTSKKVLFQPYVGFQSIEASASGNTSSLSLINRIQVANLNKDRIILGVSMLRKLTSAWFIKLNYGTDIFNLGLGFKF